VASQHHVRLLLDHNESQTTRRNPKPMINPAKNGYSSKRHATSSMDRGNTSESYDTWDPNRVQQTFS
jgi:hypothetical protein